MNGISEGLLSKTDTHQAMVPGGAVNVSPSSQKDIVRLVSKTTKEGINACDSMSGVRASVCEMESIAKNVRIEVLID
jgi:hypothetical protein